MSVIPQNKLDRQWSEDIQSICKEECTSDKIYRCIGHCASIRKAIYEEMTARILPEDIEKKAIEEVIVEREPKEEPKKEGSRREEGIVLEVLEHRDNQTTQMGEFRLREEDNESFLPQWRSIGEMYLDRLGGSG